MGASLFALWALFFSFQSYALDFSHYYSEQEIQEFLLQKEEQFPKLVELGEIGKSTEGKPLLVLEISDGNVSNKPVIYINGTHHGDELSSTESVLEFIDELLARKDEPKIQKLLQKYVIWVQPVVNPDGFVAKTRQDSLGRDLNRDYYDPHKKWEDSFFAPETTAIKNLVESHHVVAALALHSGEEAVLWPWCYTGDKSPDEELFKKISQDTAQTMGFNSWLQSYNDYPTTGEFIDYLYSTQRTTALTVEVSQIKAPPIADIPAISKKISKGIFEFISDIDALN